MLLLSFLSPRIQSRILTREWQHLTVDGLPTSCSTIKIILVGLPKGHLWDDFRSWHADNTHHHIAHPDRCSSRYQDALYSHPSWQCVNSVSIYANLFLREAGVISSCRHTMQAWLMAVCSASSLIHTIRLLGIKCSAFLLAFSHPVCR